MLTFDYKYVYYDIRLNNYAPILWDDVVFCDCYLGWINKSILLLKYNFVFYFHTLVKNELVDFLLFLKLFLIMLLLYI